MEMLVVLTIVALVFGSVLVSFTVLNRTTAKSAAARMAAAIRYTYDRSITTGGYFRLVVDLSQGSYWIERSDERFYLVRGQEKSPGRGQAPDEEEAARRRAEEDEEEAENQPQMTGIAAQLLPPPRPKRAMFKDVKDANVPKVELKDVRIRDFYTARQSEPYSEGRAYLYFFPDGHTERALIHVEEPGGDVFSLIVHSLTGRVEIRTGDVSLSSIDFTVDAEGREEAPR